MPDRTDISGYLKDALDAGDTERVEELWLEALELDPIPTDQLLEVRRLLWKEGHKTQAQTLLELLVETLEGGQDHSATLAALKELVRLAGKGDAALIERLELTVTRDRAGSPSLAAVLERYPLARSRRPVEVLESIELWLDHDLGTIVQVAGQGVGTVVDVNLELENLKVDVGGPKPVSVPFGAITRYVSRLPAGDFRRRSVDDREALLREVEDSPGDALVHLLESLGEPVDVATIKAALDGMVEPQAWTGWWNRARKHPRLLTSGSGSRLKYAVEASAEAADEALLDDLLVAEPRDRLAIARRLATRSRTNAAAAFAIFDGTFSDLSAADPGLAWETAGAMATLPANAARVAGLRAELIASSPPLGLLSGIQDANCQRLIIKRTATDELPQNRGLGNLVREDRHENGEELEQPKGLGV